MKKPIARCTNVALLLSCAALIALQFEVAGPAAQTSTASASQSSNAAAPAPTVTKAKDPGVRAGAVGAGGAIKG